MRTGAGGTCGRVWFGSWGITAGVFHACFYARASSLLHLRPVAVHVKNPLPKAGRHLLVARIERTSPPAPGLLRNYDLPMLPVVRFSPSRSEEPPRLRLCSNRPRPLHERLKPSSASSHWTLRQRASRAVLRRRYSRTGKRQRKKTRPTHGPFFQPKKGALSGMRE